jgi:hypothetical protein
MFQTTHALLEKKKNRALSGFALLYPTYGLAQVNSPLLAPKGYKFRLSSQAAQLSFNPATQKTPKKPQTQAQAAQDGTALNFPL